MLQVTEVGGVRVKRQPEFGPSGLTYIKITQVVERTGIGASHVAVALSRGLLTTTSAARG